MLDRYKPQLGAQLHLLIAHALGLNLIYKTPTEPCHIYSHPASPKQRHGVGEAISSLGSVVQSLNLRGAAEQRIQRGSSRL